jgi:hypothetical protein
MDIQTDTHTHNEYNANTITTTISTITNTVISHKTTHTIKDTLHTMNTMQIQLQLQ